MSMTIARPNIAKPTHDHPIASALLGPVIAPAEARYAFPAGLYGFEACCGYVLVPAGRPALFWLQSTEEPGLVFLLAEPGQFFPQHEIDVPGHELESLAGPAAHAAEFVAFVIVTLGDEPGAATANLQAPLVLHTASRTGRQVVLDDGHQRVRVPLAIG